jgi:DNA-binding transcriptional LysR family regulator
LAALEEAFGAKLLSKSTRRLALTAAGRTLAEASRGLVQQFDDLRAQLNDAEREPSGLLRISASTGFGGRYVAPLMGEFRQLYPGISVELHLSNDLVDLVADEADVAIRVGALAHSQLRHVLLGPLHRVACASPAYLALRGRPARAEDLADHDCIIVRLPGRPGDAWHFRGARFRKLDAPLVANSHEAAVAMARSGAGIVHLPYYLVRDELERGELEQVLAGFDMPEIGGVHLLWHERPPARVKAFIQFIRHRIRAADLMPAPAR